MFLSVPINVWLALGSAAAVLAAGSLLRCWWLRGARPEEARGRLGSLIVWWTILLLLAVAAVTGRAGVVLIVTLTSGWALWEYLGLTGGANRVQTRWLALACLVPQAVWIYLDWYQVFAVFLPLCVLAGVPGCLVLAGRTRGFLGEVTQVGWGLLLTGYALGHAAYLSVLPAEWNPRGGAAGWFIYLVLLTQANDIAQALCGRRFGRLPLARRVSPHKTWEGLLSGLAVTVVLSLALAPWLTSLADGEHGEGLARVPVWLSRWPAALAAVVIVAAGLLGDLTVSALKRDLGVKDTGSILPTQGGILDRVDSLLLASPALFYLVCWWHSR
ncbi:MAG: phosphatidate cytidylyltransferase [Pirellulaceae bacterium]|nr:phosphatidate cytidylyltransferase [Pirellulaceae bacterium]